MIISDLEFFLVEIACLGPEPPVRSLLVQLTTNTGVRGWGEARVAWRPAELPARREWLLQTLAGRNVFDIEELLGLEALRNAPLRCAVEMASWDAVGRALRQPLCHLFGGGYRRRIPLAVYLARGTAQQTAETARELADRGFHVQVVPSCGQTEGDLETLSALRSIAQERTDIQLDAAERLDLDSARDFCNQADEATLDLLIDPLPGGTWDQMASLRRQVNTPLGVSRAIQSPTDVLGVVRWQAATSVIVDLQRVGGMVPARKCAAIAQAAGLGTSLGSGPSLGLARAAMLQLAAATPTYNACYESSHHHLQDDLLVEPLEIIDGLVAVPQGPGLGIEINRAKLERYQVGR